MRILIVPDKFKGTLTAAQAAQAIAQGWQRVRPADQLQLLPMSDGGDGFQEVLGRLCQAQPLEFSGLNAAHEPRPVRWSFSDSQKCALLETAESNGLALLPPGKWHPFDLDTFGVGLMLRAARDHGAREVIAGIGGSATNDAGFGLARALGFRFLDPSSTEITRWPDLDRLQVIAPPPASAQVHFERLTIACDVQNPLSGPNGATRIYGPQKGMRPADFPIADRAFDRLAAVVKSSLGLDAENDPGAGAAGGLGYGLRVFAGGQVKPGFDIFSSFADLPGQIRQSELIITAEGAIDHQSQMGKGTGAIALLARQFGQPCLGLAGYLPEPIGDPFTRTWGVHPALTGLADAKARPAYWLEELAAQAAREYAPIP